MSKESAARSLHMGFPRSDVGDPRAGIAAGETTVITASRD